MRMRQTGKSKSCLPSFFKKRKSPPGICVTVKAPLTEAGGYHRGKSACSSLRVPPLKQLNEESLTAPSTGVLM